MLARSFTAFCIAVNALRANLFTMAWRSSGTTNEELISKLKANGIIKSDRVFQAMISVDRANFCKNKPYVDSPQGIGYAVTISAPHMHAHALELLSEHLQEGKRALDVGSGSGYLTACMAKLVGSTGKAVGIEHIDELVSLSKQNLNRSPETQEMLDNGQAVFVVGDGRQGYPQYGPYNAIHVGAAAPTIPQAVSTVN
ncbi:DgyrCDS7450 [Dimorphilus gyrociliatus]|uniref:Protein-L-isoaspartate O-methyltransferase n=1 Tax=Dimorphilus gyrociliatus TaxID=2664684 RepID=A0A7I8VSS1_9ANNE|nr:DgyrCDS7450 [Dimorphilus gyrociliatus]